MNDRAIIAIIQPQMLQKVEAALQALGVRNFSVIRTKGYSRYHDVLSQDGLVDKVKLEIFTGVENVDAIAAAIHGAAHTGLFEDGFVAVIPVERLFHICTRPAASTEG